MKRMRAAAAMVVRNELPYLGNCLRHLIANDVDFYIVDNESTDGTKALLTEPDIARHLIGLETYEYPGHFDWTGLLAARERAARSLDADWILFVSADEMMHSYRPGETLSAAIERIAKDGFNVIDFNEIVFLPIECDYPSDCGGFPPLLHYYFHEPWKPHLMRARRADLPVSHLDTGGHGFVGEIKLAPETMALRHYIVRSQEHAFGKYRHRQFAGDELARGWHRDRYSQARDLFQFPAPETLLRLRHPADKFIDLSKPRKLHYWQE
jgi:glycosyltransferase involved in cell wall biosynthesis